MQGEDSIGIYLEMETGNWVPMQRIAGGFWNEVAAIVFCPKKEKKNRVFNFQDLVCWVINKQEWRNFVSLLLPMENKNSESCFQESIKEGRG